MKSVKRWLRRRKSGCRINTENFLHTTAPRVQERIVPALFNFVSKLPPQILARIFSEICPHSQDDSYESCELSARVDTCMLCDLRDLSHCTQVNRQWREISRTILYHSIRIDPVHYCELEAFLAEKRLRKSFKSRNAEPENTAQARLRLLSRTLREDPRGVALKVQYLKVPYMTREICKSDLARTISILPNLRYVDLPDGAYTDDASCDTLRLEVQRRCPDLRKMSYLKGAERSLENLIGGEIWHNLEVLELSSLNMDPTTLRYCLASLRRLRALKLTDMNSFDDRVLAQSEHLPVLPPLTELMLDRVPNMTAQGLISYLSQINTQKSLKNLSLTETGISPVSLHIIVALAASLENLSITETMSSDLPADVPYLKSNSLRILHFEITAAPSARFTDSAVSYYDYLQASLRSGSLPNLQELYVLDPEFPEKLLELSLPRPSFAYQSESFVPSHRKNASQSSNPFLSPTNNRFSTRNPFVPLPKQSSIESFPVALSPPLTPSVPRALEVYSKGLDEMEWNFSQVPSRAGHQRRGSAISLRPTSVYGLSDGVDRGWTAATSDVRRSVIVGNGFGGFLAVPNEENNTRRPCSSASERINIGTHGLRNSWR
ncbi:hypothetical protein K3495_g8718 [Podosphaera aphanis]|nr:hypothetical protein K3495_g8718 [Podosphaera aphanis]